MPWTLILAALPDIIKAGQNIFDYIAKIRETAKQSEEWTPELEAKFQALLGSAKTDPAWQPDP